ncbi:MAG: Fic family protein [Xanthomonadales bacterium]|nr:Fic family protein [Xanthomonadales bacterium]
MQLQTLRDHLRRRPDDGAAWLALARQLIRTPTPQASADELHHALEQAIKSTPEALDAWLLAASVHRRQHGPAAALQWLHYTARQNPHLAAPRIALASLRADAYRLAGQWSEALAEYREVEKFRPGDPALLNNIGTCLASLERFAEAAGRFENALRLQADFPEARLNLAFLRACQGNNSEAASTIDEVLQDAELEPATRQAATALRDSLGEHQRLEPFLAGALQSGDVAKLQQALADTPAGLGRPHEPSLARLRSLADRCRDLAFSAEDFRYSADTTSLPLVEACMQANLEGGAAALDRLRAELEPASASPAGSQSPAMAKPLRQVLHFIEIGRDRQGRDPRVLQGPAGEAWLRYWHARLLRDAPDKQPGQYKVAANAIKGLPLTPAENVTGTIRALLAELLPLVPSGLPRGMFLYIAVNMIHGFADGNGRLSRFLLAWETESAGMPPMVIPTSARTQVARALDVAWLEGQLNPLVAALRLAVTDTDQLLRQLPRRATVESP